MAGRIAHCPGAPVGDRLKAELGPTRLAIFIHRAGDRDAQRRLQAGAPHVLLSGAARCARHGRARTLLLAKLYLVW